jgi:hypothetical protein
MLAQNWRTTEPIPYNATALQLTTALNSLSNIGAGGVSVTPFSIGSASSVQGLKTGSSGDDFLMGDANNIRFCYSANLGNQNWGHDVIIGGDGVDILQLGKLSSRTAGNAEQKP